MQEKEIIEIDQKEIEEINDETTWERRKFNELLNDPSEQKEPLSPIEKINKRHRELEFEKKKKERDLDMQWVRLQLYHSQDIQRNDLSGHRISITKTPEYFSTNIYELKKQLRYVTVWHNYRVHIFKDEIMIRLGSTVRGYEHNYIDYFVLINKNPGKTPNNLLFKADWGQWNEI